MKKAELLAMMAEKSGLTKADCDKALKAFEESVTEALAKGDEVQLIGFGTFKVGHSAARKAKKPGTDEIIDVPARNVPKFRAGKNLKEAVN